MSVYSHCKTVQRTGEYGNIEYRVIGAVNTRAWNGEPLCKLIIHLREKTKLDGYQSREIVIPLPRMVNDIHEVTGWILDQPLIAGRPADDPVYEEDEGGDEGS